MANNFVNYSNMTALMAAIGNKFKTAVARAANVSYDNTDSGLEATNVQDAIDEINFIEIEYSDYIELTDSEKEHHNWKLMNAPVDPPTPPGPDVPDGKTVLPINDIIVWQECAGIENGYTTLGEILNDSSFLSVLMSSNNAVDYLKRSTDFASEKPLIPVMTSNTEPEGRASSNSAYSSAYEAYKAFDQNNGTNFASASGQSTNDLTYEFSNEVEIKRFSILGASNGTSTFVFQTSLNGTDWTSIGTYTVPNAGTKDETLASSVVAKYIRLHSTAKYGDLFGFREVQVYSENITKNQSAMSYIGLSNYASDTLLADETWFAAILDSPYYESVDNAKVPTMSSNTTPEGECIGDNGNGLYKAFDKQTGSPYTFWLYTGVPGRIGYHFPTPVAVNYVRLYTLNDAAGPRVSMLRGSNDGENWTNIGEFVNCPSTKTWYEKRYMNNTKYSYYDLNITSSNRDGGGIVMNELQFYGRKDV